MGLTKKQQRFVEEYCVDFNATQAAIRAGYSEKTADVQGCRMLRNVKVLTSVERRIKKLTMSADEALLRLSCIARGSLRPFLVDSTLGSKRVDLTTEKADRHLDLIKEIEITERAIVGDGNDSAIREVKTKIKVHDAKSALVDILKIHGRFSERVEQFNYSIDWASLSDEQIERLANGEEPKDVLANQS